MTPSQKALQIAKDNNFDPEILVELAACILEEINYHKEAAAVRTMANEEAEEVEVE